MLQQRKGKVGANDGEASHVHTSLADVENLLNTLAMIDTFTMGFVMSIFNSIEYDQMVDMDTRFSSQWKSINSYFLAPDNVSLLPSVMISVRSWNSMVFLSVSLFITLGLIIGLNFSNCRENPSFFRIWEKTARIFILIAYALTFAGIVYMYSSTAMFGFSNFPKYCGIQAGLWAEYSNSNIVYNATSQSMIQGCIETAAAQKQGGNLMYVVNVICPVIMFILAVR